LNVEPLKRTVEPARLDSIGGRVIRTIRPPRQTLRGEKW
jgi:hypothetical protein